MNSKVLTPVCVCVAVVAAAIAAIVVTNNRATIARRRAEAAESRADEAKRLEKAASAEEMKSANEAARAASVAAASTNALLKAAEDARIAEAEARTAEANATAKKADAEAKRAEAKKAAAEADSAREKTKAEKLEFEKKKFAAETELAKSNAVVQLAATQLALEERRTAAILAEAKVMELRKIDFETLQRNLVEFQQELEERERALMPDVTIYNSSNVEWVADAEAEVIGVDTNRLLRARRKVLDEDNPELPYETRRLAKRDRRARKELAVGLDASRKVVVERLARLYAEALRDDRVVDADFYLKSIRQYDPLWDSKAYLQQLKEGKQWVSP